MDLLVSECETFYLINSSYNGPNHIRVGILLCANGQASQTNARFKVSEKTLDLLIPKQILDPTQVTKSYNFDLPILSYV
jgi:hypothetical protein